MAKDGRSARRVRLAVLAVGVLVGIAFTFAASGLTHRRAADTSSVSPAAELPNPVAFLRERKEDSFESYVMDRGGVVRRLGLRGDQFHDWSPDGRWVVVVRPGADSQDRLFLLQPGSGVRRRLLTRRHEYIRNVRWSPEGTTLAFEGSYDGAPAVFTADVRTLAVRLERRQARAPAWSPDGGRLAYVRFARKPVRNSLTAGKLVIRDIKTRSLKVVTSAAGGVTWSPDGDLIAFTRGPDNERRVLFVCRQDGSALRRVSTPETREGPATYVSEAPTWSPDGSRF